MAKKRKGKYKKTTTQQQKKKKRVQNGSPRSELEKKAQEIIENGVVLGLGHGIFKVSSQSQEDKFHEVCFLDEWSCTCNYYLHRHADCKHIIAVQCVVMKVPDIIPVDIEISAPDIACTKKKCKSTNYKFYENRPRKKGGVSVRYKCLDCGNRFTHRPGFLGRHYPDEAITDVLDDAVKGKSAADSVDSLKKRSYTGMEKVPGRTTAYNWLKYANDETSRIPENIPLPVSVHWTVDERYFRTMGRGRYQYDIMDYNSRFIIASKTAYKKFGYNATSLFKKGVKVTHVIPKVVSSDRLPGYKTGVNNVMGNNARGSNAEPTYHINSSAINKKHIENNRRERLNRTTKAPTITCYGFNSKNPALLGLINTAYNFLRGHMSLGGKTPAEVLGIRVRGPDKWASLLAFASTL